jgi:hypothetical protein
MHIRTAFSPATSRYISTGECQHLPSLAEAWIAGRRDESVEISEPDMEPAQMIEKAVAILRRRLRA